MNMDIILTVVGGIIVAGAGYVKALMSNPAEKFNAYKFGATLVAGAVVTYAVFFLNLDIDTVIYLAATMGFTYAADVMKGMSMSSVKVVKDKLEVVANKVLDKTKTTTEVISPPGSKKVK